MASRLLIADSTGDELWEIDPDGADTEGTLLRDLPTTLTAPYGMTVLGGRLLIADNTGDELWEIDPDGADTEGTLLRDLPRGLTAPYGMTVLGGRLLIADSTSDELWEIDPDGADTEGTLLRDLPTGLTFPEGMTVLGGRLLIADSAGDELWEIDPDGADTEGTLLRDLPTTLTAPYGMTVLGGRLLIADNAGDELWEIDPDGADTEGTLLRDLPTGLTSPFAMAVLPPPNISPTADAGNAQSVAAGVTVNLDGSGSSDPDGTIASYSWAQLSGPTVTIQNDKTATPSFTAPTQNTPSSIVIELTVTDDGGLTDKDTVSIAVAATKSHVVGAGDVAVLWAVPQPTVTLTSPQSHVVDAGDAAFAFALPEPTVTSGPTLLLSDFPTTGRNVDAAALLVASDDAIPLPGDIYVDPDRGGTDSPLDGELGLGAGQVVISRIRHWLQQNVDTLTLNDNDNPLALAIGPYFDVGGAGRGLTMTLQTADGSADLTAVGAYSGGGGGFANWTTSPGFRTILNGITTGKRFILAFWQPTVTHTVDAGDVAVVFAVPQPTVTLVQATATHTVDAGDVAVQWAVPQPNLAHEAGAGDVAVVWAIPQVAVTHVSLMGTVYSVNATDAAFVFDLPQPTVRLLGSNVHAVDAGDAAFAFALPQPTVRLLGSNVHAVDAGDAAFAFALPQPTTAVLGNYQVDAGPANWAFDLPAIFIGAPLIGFKVEVDWAGDGQFAHPASDITGDLLGNLEFSRGRGSYGSQLYGRSVAGILRCKLRNDSRQYDALSVQTSIGTLLTSQRRIRALLTYPPQPQSVQWSGYLDSVGPRERRGGMDTVSLTSLGVLALLQEAYPLVAGGLNESIGSIMGRVVESVVPGLDNSLLASSRPISRWVRDPEQTALQSVRELENTEAGFLYERKDDRLVLEGRSDRSTASRLPVMTIADDGTGDAVPDKLEPILRAQDIANSARIPVRTYRIGTSQVLWRTDESIFLASNETVRVIAQYPTPAAPTDHVGADTWEPLVAGTDYTDIRGVVVTQAVEGNQLVISLENTGAADVALLFLQVRGLPLIANDPLIVEARDDASISTYGLRTFSSPSQWVGGFVDAQAYASVILAVHAYPRRRLKVRWRADQSPALSLGVDISDRVRVIERDTSVTYFVEFVRHKIDRGLKHTVEYILSPPVDLGEAFIFDSSTFDDGQFGF